LRNEEAIVLSPRDRVFAQRHASIRMLTVIEGDEQTNLDAHTDQKKQMTKNKVVEREMKPEENNKQVEIGHKRRILQRRSSHRKFKPTTDQPIRLIELEDIRTSKNNRVIESEMEEEDMSNQAEIAPEIKVPPRISSPRNLKPTQDQPIRPVELGGISTSKNMRVIESEIKEEDMSNQPEIAPTMKVPLRRSSPRKLRQVPKPQIKADHPVLKGNQLDVK
jgi:hypothetical protein